MGEAAVRSEACPLATGHPRRLRVIDGAIVAYVLLVLYGGLMPFDLANDSSAVSRRLRRAVNYWPLGDGRAGRRDLFLNVALFVPFGMLVAGRGLAGRRSARALPVLAAVVLSAALSLGIEGLQLFSRARTAAANDFIANAAGGLMGGLAAAALFPAVLPRLADRLSALWSRRPIALVALAVAALLAADALDPLYPVTELSELLGNLRDSHVRLGPGLKEHPWHHWLVCRVGLYAVLAVLMGAAGSGPNRRWKWVKAAVLATCFAAAMEACKPLVAHRAANVANVAMAACGCAIGAVLAAALSGRLPLRVQLAVTVLLLAFYIGYHEWKPFVFAWDAEAMAARLPSRQEWIPFYQFALGARRTGEIRLLVRTVTVTAALVYAASLAGGPLARGTRLRRAAKASVAAGMLGVALELGQFLIPGRYPSPAHVLLFVLGGAAGCWAFSLTSARLDAGPPDCRVEREN